MQQSPLHPIFHGHIHHADLPDRERGAQAVPGVHDVAPGEDGGAALSAVEGEQVAEAVGVDDPVQEMSVALQLRVHPLLHILRRYLAVAPFAPGIGQEEGVATFGARLAAFALGERDLVGPPYDEMVPLPTHRMSTPPHDTALVTVHGSGPRDVLLDDVQRDHHLGRVQVADAEEDPPRGQGREGRRREGGPGAGAQELGDPRPEGPARELSAAAAGGGGGEGEEVGEVGGHSPLEALVGSPAVVDAHGGEGKKETERARAQDLRATLVSVQSD